MLYYIHGYLSSPDGTKGNLFEKTLNAKPIQYRTCEPEDLVIADCLQSIYEIIKDDPAVTLIGSSLGGFLAAETAVHHDQVKKLILLNPAVIPPDVDVSRISDMPQRILQDMQDPELFTKKMQAQSLVIIGTEDEVVPNRWGIDFSKVQESHVRFVHDDHQLSTYLTKLPNMISEFLNQKH
jgi:predicted esterase YcpF (UPF0227 family)